MFPLYDSSNGRKTFPFVNIALIILNVYAFYLQLSAPDFDRFIYQYAFIPADFSILNPFSYFYIFTSIFMHGGFMHIISNMWFLHIFGDNVEDHMGHFKYLLFYLAAGVAASLGQYIISSESLIPMVGASGAISGVAGAYFILFGKSKIRTLMTLGFYISTIDLPAWVFLGLWFAIQLFSGFSTFDPGAEGGVAWFAHIAGFLFGWIVGPFIRAKRAEMV